MDKIKITMAQQKDHIGKVNKMMTAVEYLIDELIEMDELTPLGLKVLEKAKQMEKKQIVNAFDNGRNAPDNYVGYGSQYFYETYEI